MSSPLPPPRAGSATAAAHGMARAVDMRGEAMARRRRTYQHVEGEDRLPSSRMATTMLKSTMEMMM